MISDAAAFFSPSGTSNNHMLRSGTKHLSPKPCAQDTGSCRLQRALPMLPACVATSIICHHTLKACQTPVLGYQHLNSRCAPDRLAAKSCHHIMTSQTDGLARSCIDGKAKPPGSLGQLEHWAVRCVLARPSLHCYAQTVTAAGCAGASCCLQLQTLLEREQCIQLQQQLNMIICVLCVVCQAGDSAGLPQAQGGWGTPAAVCSRPWHHRGSPSCVSIPAHSDTSHVWCHCQGPGSQHCAGSSQCVWGGADRCWC